MVLWRLDGTVGCAGSGDWTVELGVEPMVWGEEYSLGGRLNTWVQGILGEEGYTLGWLVLWELQGGGVFGGGGGFGGPGGFSGPGGFGGPGGFVGPGGFSGPGGFGGDQAGLNNT